MKTTLDQSILDKGFGAQPFELCPRAFEQATAVTIEIETGREAGMSGLGRAGGTGSYCREMGAGLGSECVVDGWGEGVRKEG